MQSQLTKANSFDQRAHDLNRCESCQKFFIIYTHYKKDDCELRQLIRISLPDP